jgi:hypothetical protein
LIRVFLSNSLNDSLMKTDDESFVEPKQMNQLSELEFIPLETVVRTSLISRDRVFLILRRKKREKREF